MAICRAQRLRGPSGGGLVDSGRVVPSSTRRGAPTPPSGPGLQGQVACARESV